MQIKGTRRGYPVINGIPRLTPELAHKFSEWVNMVGLEPPKISGNIQALSTVHSFGFQWSWDYDPRTRRDLEWRAAGRFGIHPRAYSGKLLLDAGCGAGGQSRFFLDNDARVVSVDLSDAIEVAARSLQGEKEWVGVQADIMTLPFEDGTFDFIYCEGVIQHTADSRKTVEDLTRVLHAGGEVLATHYPLPRKWHQKMRHWIYERRRKRLSRMDPYHLLAWTGLLSLTAQVPLLGFLMRKAGLVVYNSLMPDLKGIWSCTYDMFGSHAHQRHISPEAFRGLWSTAGEFENIFSPENEPLVHLRKRS